MTNYECVIPCAGLSERMGAWKPMVPYRGRPLILSTVEKALRVSPRVVLVTGYRAEELEELFSKERRILTVRNGEYQRGMFSSIQSGVTVVAAEWFFITLGDMPEIPEKLFEELAGKTRGSSGYDIIRPVYGGKPGHPVLLRKSVAATLLSLPHGANMQKVFALHRERTGAKVMNLPVDDPGCIYDVDTRQDLGRAPGA